MNKKHLFILYFVLSAILVSSRFVSADSVNKKETKPDEIKLTIKESMLLALKNNLDISIVKISPKILETDIVITESVFDPSYYVTGGVSQSKEQSASVFADPEVGKIDGYNIGTGVTKKFITGTDVSLYLESNRLNTNSKFQGLNPQYSSSLGVKFNQPLLKNFGSEVNKSKIKIAIKNKEGSRLELKHLVIKTLGQVQTVYWDLKLAIENHEVNKESLELANKLENRIREQVKVGVLAPIEITQAKAEVASREEELIVSRNKIEEIEDNFRKLINLDPKLWVKPIIPTDNPIIRNYIVSEESDITDALNNRPDYLYAKSMIEKQKLDITYNKNQLKPLLNLFGAINLNGLSGEAITISGFGSEPSTSSFGGDYWESYGKIGTGRYYDWQIGMSLDIPFGNRRARSLYYASKLKKNLLDKQLMRIKQNIHLEVRNSIRSIKTNIKRINAAHASRKLAEEKLSAEETKFKVGLSTSFNVLEYQRDLSIAKNRELLAISDYNKSIAALDVVKGVILEKNQIYLDYM